MSAENCTRKLLLITLAVALLWSITRPNSNTISTDRGVNYQTRKIQEKYVMPKLGNIAKLNYADMHEGRADTHDDEEEELKLNEATGGDDTIEDDSFTKTNTTPMPNNNKIVADTQGKKLKRAEYLTYLKKNKEELMQEKEIKNLESAIHNLTLDLNDE